MPRIQLRGCDELPTVEQLRAILSYDPLAGGLSWKMRDASSFADGSRTAAHQAALWNSKYAGKPAFTSVGQSGHLRGRAYGCDLLAHRVAWALYHGEWPALFIDHINMNPADNRLANMRLATRRQNGCNRKAVGRSRYLGVAWHGAGRKWMAALSVNNRTISLGLFEDEREAAQAYDAGARKHHGEYARLNFPE